MPRRQPEPEPGDLTPEVGAETDVSPLGRGGRKPAHERTADEDRDEADWDRLAAAPEFKKLLADKRRFIVPATVFFVVYFVSLPVLVGYAPRLMETNLLGVNLAYLFALSQFLMAWVVAGLYVRAAAKWDEAAARVIEGAGDENKEGPNG